MIGQCQKSSVEFAFLADKDAIHNGTRIVVNHALRHPAKEGKGSRMRIEHHFLRLAGISGQKHLTAVRQAEMRQLDGLGYPAQHDMLVAPVELTGIARGKHQRYEGVRRRGRTLSFPAFYKALNTVVRTQIARSL